MLLNLPDTFVNELLKKLDFRSILILRKVCHSLRNFIDVTVPDSRLRRFGIIISDDNIIVHYGKYGKIRYCKNGNGCHVESRESENPRFIEDMDYEKSFFEDLKYWISEPVEIRFGIKNEPNPNQKLHVQISDQSELQSIFPYLDPEHLKEVVIFSLHLVNETMNTLDIDDFVKKWINLKIIGIPSFYTSGNLQNFTNLKECLLYLENISLDDLTLLKQSLLLSVNFETFNFDYKNLIGGDRLSESFGDPFIEDDKRAWYFQMPNSEYILGIIHANSDPPHFVFSRLTIGLQTEQLFNSLLQGCRRSSCSIVFV
uniref:F-box domain-containing protein n=1 Tax=Caenorhabditis tropicalis TaxID=1561998 RepID=A0A1I7UWK5_9PELO